MTLRLLTCAGASNERTRQYELLAEPLTGRTWPRSARSRPQRPFEPFRPGGEFVTFDIPDVGRVGLCVCYDLWFPEVIRHLAWMGAELVVCPTQTSTRDRSHELVPTQANAIQNQVFVLSANAAEPAGTGRSVLVDPEGLIRYQAPSEAPAVLTDVYSGEPSWRSNRNGSNERSPCGRWCCSALLLPAHSRVVDRYRLSHRPVPPPSWAGCSSSPSSSSRGLNIIGMRVATRVNIALISFQVLVLAFFVIFSIAAVVGDHGAGGVFSMEPFWNTASTISAVSAGAALTAYSFIGFDAVSTFAEEVIEPRTTVPRAIVLTALIAGVIFVIVVLPGRVFAHISPRLHAPVLNLLLTGAVGLLALFLTVASSTSFINFGAFTAFAFVNISVVFQYVRDRRTVDRSAVSWVLQPLIGLAVTIWLLAHLDSAAIRLGSVWVVIGFVWLVYLTKGFRRPPPEMDFTEDEGPALETSAVAT